MSGFKGMARRFCILPLHFPRDKINAFWFIPLSIAGQNRPIALRIAYKK
jgi:hypothetical protein